MGAYDTTTRDLANALLGKARHNQTVRVVKSRHGGYSIFGGMRDARFVVLVDGQFFEAGRNFFARDHEEAARFLKKIFDVIESG